MKGVRRFGIKGKLTLHYIGMYPIIDKYGPTSYQVELAARLSRVHIVFHVCHIPKFSFQNVNHFPTRNLKFIKEFIYFNLK
jgi:hypothetical protein